MHLVCFWRSGGEFFGMGDQRLKSWIVLKGLQVGLLYQIVRHVSGKSVADGLA